MPGLYPVDQTLNIYGNEVLWPGLDPVTGKFTNGDFSNPQKKPSFIPADTINLVLDNLQTFISGLGLVPNNTDPDQLLKAIQNKYSTTEWLMDFLFPVGCSYKQGFSDPTPLERQFPGIWEIWSGRAVGYELISGALPNYTEYTPGANYAAGVYKLYHLAGDDWNLFYAKEAITGAAQYLDPVKWDKLQPGIIVERRHLQGWDDDDFIIGEKIPSGPYAGWTVSGVIVPGGKFERTEGGFSGTFITSGIAGDTIREMIGDLPVPSYGALGSTSGVFEPGQSVNNVLPGNGSYSSRPHKFKASNVVHVGNEFAPRHYPIRIWHRVA